MKNRITRPKYPLLFEGGSRTFFSALVYLGNEIANRGILPERVGEIQLFPHACCWWFRVYERP